MARRFGTIRLLASGRFQALYEHRLTGGKQIARSFATRAEAESWLTSERRRLDGGDWQSPALRQVKLNDFFVEWLGARTLAPRTRELYGGLWNRYIGPRLGRLRMTDMNPTVVRSWHAELVRAPRPGAVTVAKAYRLLSTVMGDAHRDGLVDRHPCVIRGAGVERSPEMRTITPAQMSALSSAIDDPYKTLVLVAGYGGLRWGECTGLALRCVDFERCTIRVERVLTELTSGAMSFGPPKTAASRRTVHIPPIVLERLANELNTRGVHEADALVFTTKTGRPMRRAGFTKTWRRATVAAGVAPLRFHDLRHTAATLAAVHGATIREVQARLGHSTPHAALRYQHAVDARDREIARRLERLMENETGSDSEGAA